MEDDSVRIIASHPLRYNGPAYLKELIAYFLRRHQFENRQQLTELLDQMEENGEIPFQEENDVGIFLEVALECLYRYRADEFSLDIEAIIEKKEELKEDEDPPYSSRVHSLEWIIEECPRSSLEVFNRLDMKIRHGESLSQKEKQEYRILKKYGA